MRNLSLTRDEAEWLVDLLEDCDPKQVGNWRHRLADDIRRLFGMCSYEDEQKLKNAAKEQSKSDGTAG